MAKKKHHKPNTEYTSKTKNKIGSGDWWQPRKGEKEMFRVLPAFDKRGICILRRVLHYGFEVDGRSRAFPCLEDNEPWLEAEACPVDHVVAALRASGDKDEMEAADDLDSSSAKFVVQGIDVNKPDKGVQKWAAPLSFGKYFIDLIEDEDIEDVTDPEDGYDIIIEKSGKGRGTKYEYRMRPKSTEVAYDNWEAELEDLTKTTEVKDARELADLLIECYGNSFDIEEYLEDFDFPKKGKNKKKEKEEEDGKSDYTKKQINKMKKKPLLKLIKDEDLDIDDDDWDDLEELREAVIDELDL